MNDLPFPPMDGLQISESAAVSEARAIQFIRKEKLDAVRTPLVG